MIDLGELSSALASVLGKASLLPNRIKGGIAGQVMVSEPDGAGGWATQVQVSQADVLYVQELAQDALREATRLDALMQQQLDYELSQKSDYLHLHRAVEIPSVPAGGLVSTDVQDALNELDTHDSTESSTRASADTTLQSNINSEASTRSAADIAEAATRAYMDAQQSYRQEALLAQDMAQDAQREATALDADDVRALAFELSEKAERIHTHDIYLPHTYPQSFGKVNSWFLGGIASGTYAFINAAAFALTSGNVLGTHMVEPSTIPAVPGTTLQVRMYTVAASNNTAPFGSSGSTATFGLSPISANTGGAAALTVTLGAQEGATAITNVGNNGRFIADSGWFTPSAPTSFYIPTVVTSAATQASSVLMATTNIMYRYL